MKLFVILRSNQHRDLHCFDTGAFRPLFLFAGAGTGQAPASPDACRHGAALYLCQMADDLYQFSARTSDGKELALSDLRGKVVLVVNTATQCGLTPQFEGLERLYQEYKDKGLVILGFPCNQFGGQEPLSNESMAATCKINYGVSFPLTEKVEVNGEQTHPVFKWLKSRLGGFFGSRIKWNFTKFLVNAEGRPVRRFSPVTKPEDIEPFIKKLL
jgi:glutathione peroxidase